MRQLPTTIQEVSKMYISIQPLKYSQLTWESVAVAAIHSSLTITSTPQSLATQPLLYWETTILLRFCILHTPKCLIYHPCINGEVRGQHGLHSSRTPLPVIRGPLQASLGAHRRWSCLRLTMHFVGNTYDVPDLDVFVYQVSRFH